MEQPLLIPILWNTRAANRRPKYRERYQHWRELSYELPCCQTETIEAGTVIDGASVPRIAWCFMPPDGLHRRAAAIHDDIYGLQGIMRCGITLTRAQADLRFLNEMRWAGVAEWRALTAYYAVRLFGWHAWKHSRGVPLVLPVRQSDRRLHPSAKNPFTRHIYATVFTP